MASDRNSAPGPTFPAAVLGGLAAAVVLIIVAWVALDEEVAIPITVLAVICLGAALAYRTIGTSRTAPSDNRDSVPRLNAEGDRPLGDTPEAHDEISPHDLPPDHPGRHKAEEMAQEQADGETAGMSEGGAAGEGGTEQDAGGRTEPQGEARQGARTTE